MRIGEQLVVEVTMAVAVAGYTDWSVDSGAGGSSFISGT